MTHGRGYLLGIEDDEVIKLLSYKEKKVMKIYFL